MTRNQYGITARRFVCHGITVAAIAVAAFATSAWAQPANIHVYEHRTTPVPHQYIHGTLGDAKFQIALPDSWNGKFLMGARGFSGDENASGAFKTVGLQKGYAYALSDQGWFRFDIIENPEDKYYESRRRILQLTNYTKSTIRRHYGASPTRDAQLLNLLASPYRALTRVAGATPRLPLLSSQIRAAKCSYTAQ